MLHTCNTACNAWQLGALLDIPIRWRFCAAVLFAWCRMTLSWLLKPWALQLHLQTLPILMQTPTQTLTLHLL